MKIGMSKAIIVCEACEKVMGVLNNVKMHDNLSQNCLCLECHNAGCNAGCNEE